MVKFKSSNLKDYLRNIVDENQINVGIFETEIALVISIGNLGNESDQRGQRPNKTVLDYATLATGNERQALFEWG